MKKTAATYLKEEIETVINRYGTVTVYEAVGALEVVKTNLLERLGRMPPDATEGEDAK